MLTCNLTPEETSIIIDILEQVLDDLRGEIRRTDNIEYKMRLQQREVVLRKVISELNKSHLAQEAS